MKRREFFKYGAAAGLVLIGLPVASTLAKENTIYSGEYVPHYLGYKAHEDVAIQDLIQDFIKSEKNASPVWTVGKERKRISICYKEKNVESLQGGTAVTTRHKIERILMDSPTSAKPGQYRYVIRTPHIKKSNLIGSEDWELGTFVDCMPGEDYRHVSRKLIEVLNEHKDYYLRVV